MTVIIVNIGPSYAGGGGGGAPTPHAMGGVDHSGDILANLNSKITDATLDDVTALRTPTAHTLGGASHSMDSIANLNSKISDATLGGINDITPSTSEVYSSSKVAADISAVMSGNSVKIDVRTSTFGLGNITLSGEQTLNGFLTSASRVLVTDQTLGEDNGIYITAAGAWARATDYDGNPDSEIANGDIIHVNEGTSLKNKYKYLNVTQGAITVGVTSLLYSEHKDIDFGTTSGTACEGNDSRLSDARTPKHTTQTLTFDATQDWDVSVGTMATLTLTANCTFDAPLNLEAGGEYVLILNTSTFDVTSWDSVFSWVGGNAPVLPASSKVVIFFMYDGTDLMGVMNGGFA